MPKVVKCDICGGLYNQSHLNSHKRLSHGKRRAMASPLKNEAETVRAILSMYEQLSDEGKREVLNRLVSGDRSKT